MLPFTDIFNNVVLIDPVICEITTIIIKILRTIELFTIFNFHHWNVIKNSTPWVVFTDVPSNLNWMFHLDGSFNDRLAGKGICVDTIWIITVIRSRNQTTNTSFITNDIRIYISFFDISFPNFTGDTTHIPAFITNTSNLTDKGNIG